MSTMIEANYVLNDDVWSMCPLSSTDHTLLISFFPVSGRMPDSYESCHKTCDELR